MDLWVDGGKIVIEIKVAPAIEAVHKAQAISYLKVTDADLAIVVNYGGPVLEDQRLPNFLRDRQPEFVWQQDGQSLREVLLYPDLVNALQRVCHCVHFTLGPGLLHQVYRRATMIELRHSGLSYRYLKRLPVEYEGQLLGHEDVRLILIEDRVLLATFALKGAADAMPNRLRARLRQLGLELGILANFHGTRLVITPVRLG